MLFGHETTRPGGDRATLVLKSVEHGNRDHAWRVITAVQGPNQVEPARTLEFKISENKVGVERVDRREGVGSVVRLTANDQPGFALQSGHDAPAHEWVVLHHEDAKTGSGDLVAHFQILSETSRRRPLAMSPDGRTETDPSANKQNA